MFAKHVLLGASALIAVTSLSVTAEAADLYGGGASLPAPYHRQAADCYGVKTDLLIRQGGSVAPDTLSIPYFNNGTDDCATLSKVDSSLTVHYTSTGSGTGIKGYVANNPSLYGWTDGVGTEYPDVDYAISEAPITLADIQVVTPGATSLVTPAGGPVVQIPMLIAPVAIAYDPVYRDANGVEQSLNIATVDGKLHLSRENYCKIFNGELTDWSDAAFKTDNNNQLLAASSVAIQVVGRSDSSGTTNLFTRHLGAICDGFVTTNVFPDDGGKVIKTFIDTNPSITNYLYADQNFGVATAINYFYDSSDPTSDDNTPVNTARIGYAGADHVEQWAARTGANGYALDAAVLENHDGSYVTLSPAAAIDAFDGAYTLPSGTALANPDAWVGIDTQAHKDALYDPAGGTSYPIIGTSNILAYTCYDNDHSELTKVRNYVSWYFTPANLPTTGTGGAEGILSYAGLAAVPGDVQDLVRDTFLDNSATLRIRHAFHPTCNGYTGG